MAFPVKEQFVLPTQQHLCVVCALESDRNSKSFEVRVTNFTGT